MRDREEHWRDPTDETKSDGDSRTVNKRDCRYSFRSLQTLKQKIFTTRLWTHVKKRQDFSSLSSQHTSESVTETPRSLSSEAVVMVTDGCLTLVSGLHAAISPQSNTLLMSACCRPVLKRTVDLPCSDFVSFCSTFSGTKTRRASAKPFFFSLRVTKTMAAVQLRKVH